MGFKTKEWNVIRSNTFEAARVLINKLLKLYGGPQKFKLPQRDPNFLETLEMTLSEITMVFDNNPIKMLKKHEYFSLFMKTLQEILTNFMVVTMGTSEREADDPTSEDYEVLVDYMVALRYRVYELQSIFSQGKEVWPLTPIVDAKAREYWESHYENAHCVDWDEFYHDWKAHFGDQIKDSSWELPLLHDMDPCHDTSISRWEFNHFVELYMPFTVIMTTWRAITNRHPGNKRYLGVTEIKRTLNEIRHIRGSYCFAMDPSRPGRWVKLYVDLATGHTMDADVKGPLYYTLAAGMDDGSLKYPDGVDRNIDVRTGEMKFHIDDTIVVDTKKHSEYAMMDSTFELCKVCQENRKDVKLSPCDHLLCRKCYDAWNDEKLEEGVMTRCPYCRGKIDKVIPIEVKNPLTDKKTKYERPPMRYADGTMYGIKIAPQYKHLERHRKKPLTEEEERRGVRRQTEPMVPYHDPMTANYGDGSPHPSGVPLAPNLERIRQRQVELGITPDPVPWISEPERGMVQPDGSIIMTSGFRNTPEAEAARNRPQGLQGVRMVPASQLPSAQRRTTRHVVERARPADLRTPEEQLALMKRIGIDKAGPLGNYERGRVHGLVLSEAQMKMHEDQKELYAAHARGEPVNFDAAEAAAAMYADGVVTTPSSEEYGFSV